MAPRPAFTLCRIMLRSNFGVPSGRSQLTNRLLPCLAMNARIWPIPRKTSNVRERAGFWRDDAKQGRSYLFYPDAFREACAGLDTGIVARALAERGMLEPGSEKLSKLVRLPTTKKPQRFD